MSNEPIIITPRSAKLDSLKVQRDAVSGDYKNPQREQIIRAYHAEMTVCGRHYYNDRLERLSRINGGSLYGEDTMLAMLADGSLTEVWEVPENEIFGLGENN